MPDLSALNPQQREAVEAVHGPVLILAGAGTGKTRVITYRVAHLIDQGISPANILAVTFTNKAAREMQERVSTLLPRRTRDPAGQPGSRPTICTFHALGVRILRRHAHQLGYKPNFVIYDESEQMAALKRILSHVGGPSAKADPAEVLAYLSRIRNRDPAAGDPEGKSAELAMHIRRRYESALRACNAVDFDDLILLVQRLFEEQPPVLEECRRRYRHVMVDEYQDTNGAQFRLIHALTREHQQLCVVGDDDQSIYGWRGADITNLLEMERHYPTVKVIKLEQNYRSTTTILALANAVIRHNTQRRGKQLWSRGGAGAKVLLQACTDDEEEARAVVDAIEFDRTARQTPWSDQAVLFRTNSQSRPIEQALRRAGVRYRVVGGQSFFDRREIRDFIAYLKTFANPDDDVSLLRIANVPARGLSDATMERLLAASHEKQCSVYAVMRGEAADPGLPARARHSLADFVGFVEQQRSRLESEPGLALRTWAEGFLCKTGYLDELRRSERDADAAENRVRNVLDLAASLDQSGLALIPADRLRMALEELTLDPTRDEEDPLHRDSVTLITMHSCKGLEFPHVQIVGVEEGLLPHSRSMENGTLDEERRLFYVAITRAMRTLSLSHCGTRKRHGQPVPRHPSRFLKDLPPELLEEGGGKKVVSVEAGRSLFDGMRALVDSAS